jgi:hypothetical protein
MHMRHLQHIVHKNKHSHTKFQQFVVKGIYIIGTISPAMAIPQVYKIWFY